MNSQGCCASTTGDHFPAVSVIVPTYNRPEGLVQAIRSILAQTYQDFEIIVVNDAGETVERVVEQFAGEHRITYVRHAYNQGLAAARNTGIRVAKGKYIAYLDDDDRYFPNHLETLVTVLERGTAKVAYSDAYRVHQVKVGDAYVDTERDIPYSFDFDPDRFLVGNYVPVLCFMHEKACLDVVGHFDEMLTSHEDWELWIRLSRHYAFTHIRMVTCEFTWRQDGSSMTSGKRTDYLRTLKLIYAKHAAYALDKPHVVADQQRNLAYLEAEIASLRQHASPRCEVLELPNRRSFNVLTLAHDPDLKLTLEAFLNAFVWSDDIALHVLTVNVLSTHEVVLELLEKLGMDAEYIPDVSLIEVRSSEDEVDGYLAAADLVLGSSGLVQRAKSLGVSAFDSPDVSSLRQAFAVRT